MSTILIVEDSPIIRQPIEAALSRSGFETMSAEHGAEALERIEQQPPDLILLDLAMPVMDGLAMLKSLRAGERSSGKPPVPVIILTAIAEKARVLEAAQLGISAYLLKSRFSLQEMTDLIEKTLSTSPQVHKSTSPQATGDGTPHPLNGRSEVGGAHPAQGVESMAAQDLASLKPVLSRSELTERLENCGELKGLSPAVAQVLKLTGSSRCSIEQVARAIGQDHAMALKVLKLANSAVYTRGEPVDNLQTAVTRIGLGQIRQTVLNISVIDHFTPLQNGEQAEAIHFGQFWEHAIATGIIAAEITRHRDEKEADTAFTMGLLHDVGRMYFMDQLNDVFAEVLETAQRLEVPLEQVESRMLLYNHADVMDRLLHVWKFPKQLINPIVYHHLSAGNIRRNAPRQFEEVATLGLANRLAHAMMLGSSGNETIYRTDELCEMLKLDPAVIEKIIAPDGAREESDKVKFALLANSGGANWPQLREVHRNELCEPLRPLFVSDSPHYDAYRIFCNELSQSSIDGSEQSEKPNLGVIHLTQARDRVSLTTAYRAAESEAGVSNLPLLILSPAGKITPENSLLAGRRHEALATPFVIPKFIATVNRLLSASSASATAKAA